MGSVAMCLAHNSCWAAWDVDGEPMDGQVHCQKGEL